MSHATLEPTTGKILYRLKKSGSSETVDLELPHHAWTDSKALEFFSETYPECLNAEIVNEHFDENGFLIKEINNKIKTNG